MGNLPCDTDSGEIMTPIDKFLAGLTIARNSITRASFYNSGECASFTCEGMTEEQVHMLETLGWEVSHYRDGKGVLLCHYISMMGWTFPPVKIGHAL